MKNKEWAKRLGFCKKCGRFGRVYGGPKRSLCRGCLELWFEEQAQKFLEFSKGKIEVRLLEESRK